MTHHLDPLLRPKSIAVVGASPNGRMIGGIALQQLKAFRFKGVVYPINRNHEMICGWKCLKTIDQLPFDVDLVILAINKNSIPDAIYECKKRNVKSIIIYASGYNETGVIGEKSQKILDDVISDSGIAVGGPNTIGNVNVADRTYTSFAEVYNFIGKNNKSGNISILSQSGNIGATLVMQCAQRHINFSHVINSGNEAYIDYSDYLDFLIEDPSTLVIIGYIEEIRNPEKFAAAARRAISCGKHIIIYKSGITSRGAEAIKLHTSALAGKPAIYSEFFRNIGVNQVTRLGTMLDLAILYQARSPLKGTRVAILSVSGAAGAILADQLLTAGINVPKFSAETNTALSNLVDGGTMAQNPVDMTGRLVQNPELALAFLNTIHSSGETDVIIFYAPSAILDSVAIYIEKCIYEGHEIIVIDTGKSSQRDAFQRCKVPVLNDIDALADCLPYLFDRSYSERKKQLRQTIEMKLPDIAFPQELNEHTLKKLLMHFNIPCVSEATADNVDDAIERAQTLGFPVVLKSLDSGIIHKSELGGVMMNLASTVDVKNAFQILVNRDILWTRDINNRKVLVQKQHKPVAELIVGFTYDESFGLLCTVGFGGVTAELYSDVVNCLWPFDREDVGNMLKKLKTYKLLTGYRNSIYSDLTACCEVIEALGFTMWSLRTKISQLEVNPLMIFGQGEGVAVIDVAAIISNN